MVRLSYFSGPLVSGESSEAMRNDGQNNVFKDAKLQIF